MDIIKSTTLGIEEYKYEKLSSPKITFRVKASNDAHIVLSEFENLNDSDHVVEIFIGGWKNQESAFRLNRKEDSEHFLTPNILSHEQFRGFWIIVDHSGVISVGQVFQDTPFMKFKNPKPFPVNFFGVRTGHGAIGEWKIKGEDIITEDKLEYKKMYPMPSFSLDVQVKAAHDAHIALTSARGNTDPMYEVFIGGWENQQSGIRFNKTVTNDEPRRETPYVLSGTQFRRFHVSWKNGLVELKNGDGQVLVRGQASNLVSVTHFGIRTFHAENKVTGEWTIVVAED